LPGVVDNQPRSRPVSCEMGRRPASGRRGEEAAAVPSARTAGGKGAKEATEPVSEVGDQTSGKSYEETLEETLLTASGKSKVRPTDCLLRERNEKDLTSSPLLQFQIRDMTFEELACEAEDRWWALFALTVAGFAAFNAVLAFTVGCCLGCCNWVRDRRESRSRQSIRPRCDAEVGGGGGGGQPSEGSEGSRTATKTSRLREGIDGGEEGEEETLVTRTTTRVHQQSWANGGSGSVQYYASANVQNLRCTPSSSPRSQQSVGDDNSPPPPPPPPPLPFSEPPPSLSPRGMRAGEAGGGSKPPKPSRDDPRRRSGYMSSFA
jgi:hypothetical protein